MNNAAAFIREGGKVEGIEELNGPIYLAYSDEIWWIQNDEFFEDAEGGGWVRLDTQGFFTFFRIVCLNYEFRI